VFEGCEPVFWQLFVEVLALEAIFSTFVVWYSMLFFSGVRFVW
jgi:hypothetical protein